MFITFLDDEENVDCAVNNSSTVANLLFDNSINPTIPNGLSLGWYFEKLLF